MAKKKEQNNGHVFKESSESVKELLTTRNGVSILILKAMVFGAFIVEFTEEIFGFWKGFFSFLIEPFIIQTAGYLFFGLTLIPLSLGITYVAEKALNRIWKAIGR